jgi:hypothetical protein
VRHHRCGRLFGTFVGPGQIERVRIDRRLTGADPAIGKGGSDDTPVASQPAGHRRRG